MSSLSSGKEEEGSHSFIIPQRLALQYVSGSVHINKTSVITELNRVNDRDLWV